MEPSTDPHDNAWPLTEELFATPFAADILMELLEKGAQKKGELREGACGGKRPSKAFALLEEKGLVEIEGRTVALTPKGRKAAEIINQIEGLLLENRSGDL